MEAIDWSFGVLGPSNTRLGRSAPCSRQHEWRNPGALDWSQQLGNPGGLGKAPQRCPVTNIGFRARSISANPHCTVYRAGAGLEYSPAFRPERVPVVPRGIWSNPRVIHRGVRLSEGPHEQAELFGCGSRNCRGDGRRRAGRWRTTHASTRTTRLYDRRRDKVSLDEVERIVI